MAGDEDDFPSNGGVMGSGRNRVASGMTDSDRTQDNIGVVFSPIGEAHSILPYTLAASYNLGALITSVILNGENYNEWMSELLNALQAKRKTVFVQGLILKPASGSPDMENWLMVNFMIVGWIRA